MLRNGFVKTSVGTLTLGERLKKIRSERRVSLNEISRYTKIPMKYLEYLDEGMYDKLPVDVYVKGFLKNYAEYLGIDEKVLIRLYEKERGIQNNLDKSRGKKDEEPRKPISISFFVLTPKLIIITLAILLVGGGVFYLYREVGSVSDAPKLIILSPENNLTVSRNSISIEGATDQDAKIFINDQPILTSDEGKFNENITLQSGTNVITVKSVNRLNKETSETLTIQSDYQPSDNQPAGGESNGGAINQKGVEIEVRIDPGPIWLSVETDGNLVFSGTMLTGATQQFTAEDKITVNSGRGNATFIKFNGKDIGALSDKDEAIRGVNFTQDTKY